MHSRYRGYSLRNKIFWGFLLVCLLSILGSAISSYIVFRNNAIEQNNTEKQRKSDALMSALDYAVSHTRMQSADLPEVLGNEILEIADINKQDLVLYDLHGDFLLSNKEADLVPEKKLPLWRVSQILKSDKRVDVQSFDKKTETTVTSSYMVLKNNMLEPISIVYLPYYHDDSAYLDVFNRYVRYIILVNLFIIIFSIWLSWLISKNLTNALTTFSDKINRLNFFEKEMEPIRYYQNDELGTLVKAYNKMLLQIQDQKERLTFKERDEAWREMAKQVAHEVKNPLTPMKLTIQNFDRKFNPEDPQITEKVHQMSATIIDQIDLIATVASAFSQFAQLPQKNNETFNLNREINSILQIFGGDNIQVHANRTDIMINMDRIYLNRIITNLITNAKQATAEERMPIINVDLEQQNKRITITVEDNGVGIPEDMYERIFEPNFTSKSSGMGLGLTMVRKMVEDYKGEINVKSRLGKGTKFVITLPSNV